MSPFLQSLQDSRRLGCRSSDDEINHRRILIWWLRQERNCFQDNFREKIGRNFLLLCHISLFSLFSHLLPLLGAEREMMAAETSLHVYDKREISCWPLLLGKQRKKESDAEALPTCGRPKIYTYHTLLTCKIAIFSTCFSFPALSGVNKGRGRWRERELQELQPDQSGGQGVTVTSIRLAKALDTDAVRVVIRFKRWPEQALGQGGTWRSILSKCGTIH